MPPTTRPQPAAPGPAPRLRRLPDDPATLPAALEDAWTAADAAVVAPPDAVLPPAVDAALDGGLPLPPGTALVVPTSGSSGEPRAVVLPHAALAASTAASLAGLRCEPGERWALALPLRHVAGLQALARARALGTAPVVVADPGDPEAIVAAAGDAQHIALVPTQVVRSLDAGAGIVARLARFRTVLVGGGPLAPERVAEAREAGIMLVRSYGMTETCGGCVYDGRPLAGVEVDVDGPGTGRVRLRGPMRATGYLDATPEDAARFTPDGWFVTDDVGRVKEGVLEVVGRADLVLNSGGVKVDPLAVERLLRAAPGVADVVVVGVPDAEWGELIRAVVVPADPSDPPTLDALRSAVAATLPTTHAPRELVLTGAIPRDAMGKVAADVRARLRAS